MECSYSYVGLDFFPICDSLELDMICSTDVSLTLTTETITLLLGPLPPPFPLSPPVHATIGFVCGHGVLHCSHLCCLGGNGIGEFIHMWQSQVENEH